MKRRKISIVIEETNDDEPTKRTFSVYMDGDKERIGHIPEEQLSTAEFWGVKLFTIVTGILNETGAVALTSKKKGKDESAH